MLLHSVVPAAWHADAPLNIPLSPNPLLDGVKRRRNLPGTKCGSGLEGDTAFEGYAMPEEPRDYDDLFNRFYTLCTSYIAS